MNQLLVWMIQPGKWYARQSALSSHHWACYKSGNSKR
jgi:hypothetical protein